MRKIYVIFQYSEFGDVEVMKMAFKDFRGAVNAAKMLADGYAERHGLNVTLSREDGTASVWNNGQVVRRFDVEEFPVF